MESCGRRSPWYEQEDRDSPRRARFGSRRPADRAFRHCTRRLPLSGTGEARDVWTAGAAIGLRLAVHDGACRPDRDSAGFSTKPAEGDTDIGTVDLRLPRHYFTAFPLRITEREFCARRRCLAYRRSVFMRRRAALSWAIIPCRCIDMGCASWQGRARSATPLHRLACRPIPGRHRGDISRLPCTRQRMRRWL